MEHLIATKIGSKCGSLRYRQRNDKYMISVKKQIDEKRHFARWYLESVNQLGYDG